MQTGGIVGETKCNKKFSEEIMKNNFKFKREFYDVIKELTDKQAGELMKGVCGYVFEGKAFITKDEYLKGVFLYLKRELDVSKLNSVNGKKGAEKIAEKKRDKAALGVLIGSMVIAAESKKKAEQ